MLPLFKIRATYLKRKKCNVFLTYLLIPIVIISSVIIYLIYKDPDEPIKMDDKQIFNYDSNFALFGDSDYSLLEEFIKNTSLVVNNRDLGQKLVNYIFRKTNITLNLYSEEEELNNHSQNILILDYNEKKKSI